MSGLALVTLGMAARDVDHAVREEGGENVGPWIEKMLANTVPPINVAAPWCAAAIQYWSDRAATVLGIENPLDDVKHEALVQSYVDWALRWGRLVQNPRPGDLVAYRFRLERYDHIGIVARVPDADGAFWAVEGNTNDAGDREGEGVYMKRRTINGSYPVVFIRWDQPVHPMERNA